MGNTGCSTGTHLHFSIVDGANRNYNPEELLQFYNVSYKSIACEEARRVCAR
jgi:murein DD-endopeptidase MepM/ murein hydrolase activator NlpD